MAVNTYEADRIVSLAAGDTFSRSKMSVDSIVLRGTAAGTFVITLGNTTLNIDNSSSGLTVQLTLNRHLNSIGLVSGPAGATMYVFLEQKK